MTVYVVIGLVGLGLLLVSLILGDVLDGLFDGLMAGDWFSSAAIGGFVAAFGFGGAIVDSAGGPTALALLVAVVAGLCFGWFAWWLTGLLRRDRGEHTPSAHDTVGHDATVVTAIPAGGYGVVRVVIGGHSLQYNAKADQEVPLGTAVHVSGVVSPTAVTVTPTWHALG